MLYKPLLTLLHVQEGLNRTVIATTVSFQHGVYRWPGAGRDTAQFQFDRVSDNGGVIEQLACRCLSLQRDIRMPPPGADTIPAQGCQALAPWQLSTGVQAGTVQRRPQWCQCLSVGLCVNQDVLQWFYQALEPPDPDLDIQVDSAESSDIDWLIQAGG